MADPSTSSGQAPSAGSGQALQGEAKRRYVADLFSRIAPRYDLMNTLMTGGMHHRWRKTAAAVATKGIEGAALDVATGTGDLAFALAGTGRINLAVGLDYLPEMVTRARSKARTRGLKDRAQFTVGDALSLPFPDGAFACATSAWGLRNMPDLRHSLEEMVRVLRPGGRLVSLESMPMERGLFRPLFRLFFQHMVPLLGQLIAGDRAAYTYLPQSVDRFLDAESLARMFGEVGLEDVGYSRIGLGAVAIHWGTKS